MLYERIKKLVDENKMTIAELERRLDFGQGTIGRWRKQSPSLNNVAKVANFFKVSTDYLSGRTEDPKIILDEPTPEFSAIQRKAERLSPAEQNKLLKLMEITFDSIGNGTFKEDGDEDI